MPYAQQHYPFENKEKFDRSFPADFIAEGLDQTRGWFYTLLVIATALFDQPPFKNLIVNGLVLAAYVSVWCAGSRRLRFRLHGLTSCTTRGQRARGGPLSVMAKR